MATQYDEPVNVPVSTGYYNTEDGERLKGGMKKHRDTTRSTERSARIALEARETAAATLGSLQEQGQQLQHVNRDLDEMGEEVKEGRSTLRDLECGRRCCCFFMLFSCCCDCDPHVERDATRKSRVKQRNMVRKVEGLSDNDAAARDRAQIDAPSPQEMAERQRQELLGAGPGTMRAAQYGGPKGEGLRDSDREAVVSETELQNRNLDIVGGAAADMRRMAHAMHEEVLSQDADVTGAQDKIDPLKASVRNNARQAFGYAHRR